MPRARFHRLDASRRDQILEIAASRFAESGYAATSYNQILEDAGLSKSSAYYLLEGKADLYAAVMQRELDALVAGVPVPSAPEDGGGYWACVRGWFGGLLVYFARNPRSAALVAQYAEASRRGATPDLDPAISAALAGPVDGLVALGIALGEVRQDLPPRLLGDVLNASLASLDRHFVKDLLDPDADLEGALDVYVDTARRLLRPG